MPDEVADVGIDEKRGDTLPLELEFLDAKGNRVRLREIFDGSKPILLSLNYSNCPLLCRHQLNGLVDGIEDMKWTAGDEFTIVSVSIDPRETPDDAKKTKQRYLSDYGRANAGDGWRFLVGSEANIKKLADAVGFRYRAVPDTNDFAHAAAIMVCTPDGKVSRYLYGVLFDEQTVRLSLVEAGEGKIGSAVDQLILYCFHYDETKGRYGPQAVKIMQVGAGATVLALSVVLVPVWLRRNRVERVPSQRPITEDDGPVTNPLTIASTNDSFDDKNHA